MNIRAAKFVQNLRGLSPTEIAVAFNIAVHCNYGNTRADMSMTTLAYESGLKNRQTASEVVGRLLAYGIIQTEGPRSGGRKPTNYIFTFTTNRDSGITVEDSEDRGNRNPGLTVDDSEPQPNRVQPQPEAAPTAIENAATATQNAPTVTRGLHEGFKALEGKREGKKEPTASPTSFSSKPTAAAKNQDAEELAKEIVVFTDGRVRFTGKNRAALFQLVNKCGKPDTLAAFKRFWNTVDDEFLEKHAANQFAEAGEDYVELARHDQAERERKAAVAKWAEEETERLRLKAEEDLRQKRAQQAEEQKEAERQFAELLAEMESAGSTQDGLASTESDPTDKTIGDHVENAKMATAF